MSRVARRWRASPSRSATAASTRGEWQDVNDGFFRCTAWRPVAENAAHTLKKGMRVFVAGKLVQRSFEVEGQKRTTVEVQVQHVGADLQFASATIQKASSEPKAS